MEKMLKDRHGADAVSSTTLPKTRDPNVKLAGQRHPKTGAPFGERGMPNFDKHVKFDTRISRDLAKIEKPEK
jgi:hypothetical protein